MTSFILSEEARRELLQSYNELRTAMSNIFECQDMWLSDTRNLERLMHRMQRRLDFAQQKDGNPYMDYVLAEDNNPAPKKAGRPKKNDS